MRSASASGPMGWLQPSFMPSSISTALATPSCSVKTASLIIGHSRRLTTKPGALRTLMGVLPSVFASPVTASKVACEVCRPLMISTSAIIGTGLKKCMPTKRDGSFSDAASRVMEMEEVLVARMASGRTTASTLRSTCALTLSRSVAASITRSAPLSAAASVVPWMRASAAALPASSSFSFLMSRSSDVPMAASPRSTASGMMSCITTSRPA